MRRKTLSTSYSPENHGRGYKQMLKKDRLSAFVSAISLYPGREIRSVREKLMSGRTRIHGESSADINYLLLNSRFLDLSATGSFWQNRLLVDAPLDSTAGGRPRFHTTEWLTVAAASAEGTAEARAALEELYRLYCYPVYAFIRRRGHGRQDAQDLTQDFFVHLLEKATLGRADSQRGRFRSFLLGALDHFLAHAVERARAGKRGGGCELVSLDDDAAENSYQLAAPEGMTAEKVFETRWAAAILEAAFA